jgi:hypothetical protein
LLLQQHLLLLLLVLVLVLLLLLLLLLLFQEPCASACHHWGRNLHSSTHQLIRALGVWHLQHSVLI